MSGTDGRFHYQWLSQHKADFKTILDVQVGDVSGLSAELATFGTLTGSNAWSALQTFSGGIASGNGYWALYNDGHITLDAGAISSDGSGHLAATSIAADGSSLTGDAESLIAGEARNMTYNLQPLAGNDGANNVIDNNGTPLNANYAATAGSAYAAGGNADYASNAGSASYAYSLPYNGQALAGNDGGNQIIDNNGNYLGVSNATFSQYADQGSNTGLPLVVNNGGALEDDDGNPISASGALPDTASFSALWTGSGGSAVTSSSVVHASLNISSLAASSGTTLYLPASDIAFPPRPFSDISVSWSTLGAMPAGLVLQTVFPVTGTLGFQFLNTTGSAISGTVPLTARIEQGGPVVATINSSYQPQGTVFTGSDIWVSNNGDNTMTHFSRHAKNLGNYSPGLNSPGLMTWDGTHVWMTQGSAERITQIDVGGGTPNITSNITTSAWTMGICYDGTNVWVANSNATTSGSDSSLVKMNPGGTIAARYGNAHEAVAVCSDGIGNIWTYGGDGYVCKFSESGSRIGAWSVTGTPVGPHAFGGLISDGTNVWVATGGNDVVVLDESGSTVRTITGFSSAVQICFGAQSGDMPNGDIWISDENANTVSLMDKSGTSVFANIPTGQQIPFQLSFDGANIWAPNINSGNVTVLH